MLGARARIEVFEKSRGFGGRMSTRRAEPYAFDHGAQYFTAREAEFQDFLAPWIAQGVVAQWSPRLTALGGSAEAPVWTAPRYVAVPGMNALARALAEGVHVHLATRIAKIRASAKGWVFTTSEAAEHGPFDWVISTAPAEQTSALFPQDFREAAALRRARMLGCYSLMLGGAEMPDPGWDSAVVEGSPIAWIARNHSKPGRGQAPSMVCQTSNDWAEAHLEDDQRQVHDALFEEVSRLTSVPKQMVDHVRLHRWRFARVDTAADQPFLIDLDRRLAAAGNWCGTGRVESAFKSAGSLAVRIQEILT
jgi:predicted NAD/FAD-dependent oxidoreductase